LATLRKLQEPGLFEGIARRTEQLMTGLAGAATGAGVPVQTAHVGTMAGLFFHDRPVTNYAEAKGSDTARYALFFHGLLRRGVYVAPSQFEALFLSSAHAEADLEQTVRAAQEVFAEIATDAN
jgi:glutamate-1-semialdehyde 2,1-aminomutase